MPPPAEGFAARFVLGPALRTQPDRRLVTLVREGYENAFEEIVRRYGKPLTRYAAAIVGGRAEDVTQDAFSKALLALRRDGVEIELRPWLFRIVRNTALNDLRDRPPSAEALAEVVASGGNPAEALERREELTELMQRLQSLPEAQRAAIVMRELEGLSHEQIANALGLSDGGARQAIYRARRALRDSAGMLLPLPLVKALLAGAAASPAVEAAAGAAGIGGAAGAGVALKAAAATVLVAGAVGAGVAIDHGRHGSHPERANAQGVVADGSGLASSGATAAPGAWADQGRSSSGPGDGRGHGEAEPGDDRRSSSKHGDNQGGHGRDDNPRLEGADDERGHSGPGGEQQAEAGDDRGGHSGPSGDRLGDGSGAATHDGSSDDGGHSGRSSGGPSGSGSGSSDGGGASGPGNGSFSTGEQLESVESSGSNSGSGSGGGDSGSGEVSGSSGSGSGDSGDSHSGEGFSIQTEPQTQEEP
jgi:RNA polymerase sigma factor (sigma-70 family)